MRHSVQSYSGTAALVLALALSAHAAADPPATDKPVRQVGGAHGPKVEQAEPEHTGAPNAASAHEAMQKAREQARAAFKEAREAMQKAPEETRAAVEEARSAIKEAPQDVRAAIEKAPEETRERVQEARDAMQNAREEGRAALMNAKDAMQKARDKVQAALPGAAQGDHDERTRYARRVAWHALMNRVQGPSAIAPEVRQELKQHAQRIANLQRIRALGADKHDDAVMQRCDKLIAREQKRHQDKLERLLPARAQAAPAAEPEDDDPAEPDKAEDEEQPETEP